MSKKLLASILAGLMTLSLVACGPKDPVSTDGDKKDDSSYKIGIITGTVSQGEEEYRSAENMKKEFGDKIVLQTYPDSFMKEQETTIANTLTLASDPAVKAIIFVQAVPGASAAIDKVRETNPDMLFVAGVPGEDPAMIAGKADIVLNADELGMGTRIIEQAKKMGAKTFIHYTFPRHMSYEMLAKRRDLFKETCAKEGIKFVDATAPDPTGDAGVPGAQQFILEDVPRKIAEFGKDTAFFSTNCAMQEPLIKATLAGGAMMPQQCCPSPYHAYPGALGIQIPDDKKGDVPYVVEQIKTKVAEKGGTGKFSTWPVPVNMLLVEAGTKYAMQFAEGKTNGRNDKVALEKIMKDIAKVDMTITNYLDTKTNKTYENYYLLLSDYINF